MVQKRPDSPRPQHRQALRCPGASEGWVNRFLVGWHPRRRWSPSAARRVKAGAKWAGLITALLPPVTQATGGS